MLIHLFFRLTTVDTLAPSPRPLPPFVRVRDCPSAPRLQGEAPFRVPSPRALFPHRTKCKHHVPPLGITFRIGQRNRPVEVRACRPALLLGQRTPKQQVGFQLRHLLAHFPDVLFGDAPVDHLAADFDRDADFREALNDIRKLALRAAQFDSLGFVEPFSFCCCVLIVESAGHISHAFPSAASATSRRCLLDLRYSNYVHIHTAATDAETVMIRQDIEPEPPVPIKQNFHWHLASTVWFSPAHKNDAVLVSQSAQPFHRLGAMTVALLWGKDAVKDEHPAFLVYVHPHFGWNPTLECAHESRCRKQFVLVKNGAVSCR